MSDILNHTAIPYDMAEDAQPGATPDGMFMAQQAALIASQARRIAELEARIADIATRIDRQVKASDGYAEEYARADDPRPTTWQIGNSHFTDLARELRALLNRGEG